MTLRPPNPELPLADQQPLPLVAVPACPPDADAPEIPMINRPAARPLSPPQSGDSDAGQLLEDFVNRVPGADSAVLASRGGTALAFAGTTQDRAACLALRMNSLFREGDGVGPLSGAPGGVHRQTIELKRITMLLMSIERAVTGWPAQADFGPPLGGWLLAVLFAPEAGGRIAAVAEGLRQQVAGFLADEWARDSGIGPVR